MVHQGASAKGVAREFQVITNHQERSVNFAAGGLRSQDERVQADNTVRVDPSTCDLNYLD